MKVTATKVTPYPGYEKNVMMNLQTDCGGQVSMSEIQAQIKSYTLGAGTEMKDIEIPGTEPGQTMKLRVITPAAAPKPSPIIMDIHGGGFVSGSVDIDNYRNIHLAEHTPCIVVSVEYRLATKELPYPAQLMDCHTAYLWLTQHADEIGGDPTRIGIHGTSAGGNLAAALSLYLRDHDEQPPMLTVLNCPDIDSRMTTSKLQFGHLGSMDASYAKRVTSIYTGLNGEAIPYYAMPGRCEELSGLNPHMVITAEYDPLRTEGMEYACRLLHDGVPCEVIQAPRVSHGFCVIDAPLTKWVHNGICASFRREFGMEIIDY